jgi:hypothetical protein
MGVEQDFKQAKYYYEQAAEQGDALAQSNLGHLYYNGDGMEQDFKQAIMLQLVAVMPRVGPFEFFGIM